MENPESGFYGENRSPSWSVTNFESLAPLHWIILNYYLLLFAMTMFMCSTQDGMYFLSLTKIPPDDVLEILYTWKTRESAQNRNLKIVVKKKTTETSFAKLGRHACVGSSFPAREHGTCAWNAEEWQLCATVQTKNCATNETNKLNCGSIHCVHESPIETLKCRCTDLFTFHLFVHSLSMLTLHS